MRDGLKFMWQYIQKKYWLFIGYGALLLECLTPILAIMLQKDMIDEVFLRGQYDLFPKMMGLYAVFFFGPKLWFTIRKVIFFHVSYVTQRHLSAVFLEQLNAMKTASYRQMQSAKLLTHLRNDVADACDISINQILSEAVFVVVTLLFLTVSLGWISPLLLLLSVGIAAIYYKLLAVFGEKTKRFSQETRLAREKQSVGVEENIASLREVTAFNRQAWQTEKFEALQENHYKALCREGAYKVKTLLFSEPLLYGIKILILLIGGMKAMNHDASIGAFVVSFTLVDQLVTAIGQLFQLSLTGKRLIAPINALQSIFAIDKEAHGQVPFKGEVEHIVFDSVTFAYEEGMPIFEGLSFQLPVGKKIAFVGESGSGKSTLAQLLLRMYTPDSGAIKINDVSINDYDSSFTEKVSMVFQSPHFMPMSIIENLTFGKVYPQKALTHACDKMLCTPFIKALPLGEHTEVGERGASLSGGQKQRLALARALLKNTEILVLDEATSALDMATEYEVQKNLDILREGKTTILIAHRLSTVRTADVIYVLEKGRIISEGTHETLMMDCETYQRLCATQNIAP